MTHGNDSTIASALRQSHPIAPALRHSARVVDGPGSRRPLRTGRRPRVDGSRSQHSGENCGRAIRSPGHNSSSSSSADTELNLRQPKKRSVKGGCRSRRRSLRWPGRARQTWPATGTLVSRPLYSRNAQSNQPLLCLCPGGQRNNRFALAASSSRQCGPFKRSGTTH